MLSTEPQGTGLEVEHDALVMSVMLGERVVFSEG